MITRAATTFLLTTATILTMSNVARADYLVSNGGGGDYNYQLWTDEDNTHYYLKIWSRKADSSSGPSTTGDFESTRDALNYFDCSYAQKDLPVCSGQ